MHTATSIQAYPLQWPVSTPRTKRRITSQFSKRDWNRSLKELREELKRLGASQVVISTNRRLRSDGEPSVVQYKRDEDDPGVAVYFQLNGQPTCFPCDRFLTMAENFRAITLTIESLRALDRYGVGKSGQAFTGFKALPATAGEGFEDPWAILGLKSTATADEIKAAHRQLATSAHPDRGGTSSQMARVNLARDRALAQLEGK